LARAPAGPGPTQAAARRPPSLSQAAGLVLPTDRRAALPADPGPAARLRRRCRRRRPGLLAAAGSAIAGTDPVDGKDIVMKGNTYTYYDDLHLRGKINSGVDGVDGHWIQKKRLNDYNVIKGLKPLIVWILILQLNY
jgi:hypothetical protein